MRLAVFIAILFWVVAAGAQTTDTIRIRMNDTLLPVKVNGKWGYINNHGEMKVSPQFDYAESFSGNMYAKVQKDGKASLINRGGELSGLPANLKIKVFYYTYLLVEDREKFGLATSALEQILPAEYDEIKLFTAINYRISGAEYRQTHVNEFILLRQDSLWGLANFNGKIILPIQYDYIRLEGEFFVVRDSLEGVRNIKGEEIIKCDYEDVKFLNTGTFVLQKYGRIGIYDTTGREIIAPLWNDMEYLNPNYAVLINKDSTVLAHLRNGKYISRENFDRATSYKYNMAKLHKNGMVGLADSMGNIIFPPQFEDFYLTAGYYYVSKGGLTGLYSPQGVQVAAAEYTYIDRVENKTVLVRKDNLWGMLNTSGKVILPVRYEDIDISETNAKARSGKTVEVYELTSKGEVTDKTVFENVITVAVGGQARSSNSNFQRSTNNLPRTNTFNNRGNWFYDTSVKKWGLKGPGNKILVKPVFNDVIRSDSSKFAIVELLSEGYSVNVGGAPVVFSNKKGLVREEDGKLLVKPVMAYIDPIVLSSKGFEYARLLASSGQFLVITQRGYAAISNCRYMDKQYDGHSRAYIGKVAYKKIKNNRWEGEVPLATFVNELGGRLDYERRRDWNEMVLDFRKGNWQYITPKGARSGQSYNWAGNFYHQRAIVKATNNRFGIVAAGLNYQAPPMYDSIAYLPYSDNSQFLIIARRPAEGFIDTAGIPLTGFNYYSVGDYNEGLAWVMDYTDKEKTQARYIYLDEEGRDALGLEFSRVSDFSEGKAAVRKSRRWMFIDNKGNSVTKEEFIRTGKYYCGRAWVKQGGKMYFIDENGTPLNTTTYARVMDYSQNIAAVSDKGQKWMFIDENGAPISTKTFKRVDKFDALGYCKVGTRTKWGLINTSAEEIVPKRYSEISGPVDGFYLLKKKNKYFLLDANGEKPLVTRLGKADAATLAGDGRVVMVVNGKTYNCEKGSTTLLHEKPVRTKNILNDYFIAGTGRNMGVVDYNGDTLLRAIYNQLKSIGDGLFYFKDIGYYNTIINLHGEVLATGLQNVMEFTNSLAPAQKNNKWGIINTAGVWVCEPKYDRIGAFNGPLARAGFYSAVSIANIDGVMLADANFEKIEYNYETKLYRIEQGRKIGYLTAKGTWLWPLEQ